MTAKESILDRRQPGGRAYVERDADIKLRRELTDNQRYLFLYGPRSGGKSSLIIHCMDSLSPGQYCCTPRRCLAAAAHRLSDVYRPPA